MHRLSLAWAGAALVLFCAAPADAGLFGGPVPVVGKPAPTFTAGLPDGSKVTLADFEGQVLIINFWATWCGPCKQELPLLDAYYKLQKDKGLRVIAVTTEDSLPMYKLKPLAKVLTIPLMTYISGRYGPIGGAVPTNYVIDRSGVVRYAKAAAFDLDDLNTVLVPLLQESAPQNQPSAQGAAASTPAP